MRVRDILESKGSEIVSIGEEATIYEAAQRLNHRKIGSLLVFDYSGKIAGIITERDILRECSEHPDEIRGRKVGDAMTREVIVGELDDRIKYVQSLMIERRIRHLPIVADERVAGMVSIGDVIKSLLKATEDENYDLRGFLAEKNVVG